MLDKSGNMGSSEEDSAIRGDVNCLSENDCRGNEFVMLVITRLHKKLDKFLPLQGVGLLNCRER
jgi:hypothetical protein